MKVRRVYSTPSLPAAETAVRVVREAGIAEDDISLVARGDIELDKVPEHQKEAPTDFKHAAVRGAAREAGVPVTRIGRIEPGAALLVCDGAGRPLEFKAGGFDHFKT